MVGVSAALYDLRVGDQHLFLLHGLDSETGVQRYIHNASLRLFDRSAGVLGRQRNNFMLPSELFVGQVKEQLLAEV